MKYERSAIVCSASLSFVSIKLTKRIKSKSFKHDKKKQIILTNIQ